MHGLREHIDQSLGDCCSGGLIVPRQHHHELVATDAPGEATLIDLATDVAADAIGKHADELVAATVAEHVVDRFETVEIAEQQADVAHG